QDAQDAAGKRGGGGCRGRGLTKRFTTKAQRTQRKRTEETGMSDGRGLPFFPLLLFLLCVLCAFVVNLLWGEDRHGQQRSPPACRRRLSGVSSQPGREAP